MPFYPTVVLSFSGESIIIIPAIATARNPRANGDLWTRLRTRGMAEARAPPSAGIYNGTH